MNDYSDSAPISSSVAIPRIRPSALMLLAGLGLLALLSSMYGRAGFPFWPDEGYTVLEVRAHSLTEMLLLNVRNEETPPLYFALLRLWAQAWGDSREATLRLFSALCVAATVPLAGWLAARLWSWRAGLATALLIVVNPLLRYYGQEARAYALAVLLATLVLLAAHCYLRRPGPRAWAAYILAGVAAFYTNYFTSFMLAGAGAMVGLLLLVELWRQRERRRLAALLGWAAAQCVIGLTLLPWLPALRYQMLVSQAALAPEGRNIWLQYVLSLLALGGSTPDGSPIGVALILLLALALPLALALALWRASLEQWLFALGGLVLPMLCVLFVFRGDGQFHPRYMLMALAPYATLLAAGLLRPWRWQGVTRILLALIVVLAAIYGFSMQQNSRRLGGWDAMARQIEAQAQPGDVIFFAPPWAQAAFTAQYQGPPLPQYGAESFAQYYYEQGHPFNEPIAAAALEQQLRSGKRAWIVWDHVYAPRPALSSGTVAEFRYGSTSLLLATPVGTTP